MRPSSPRSSRISSTTARYSVSSSRGLDAAAAPRPGRSVDLDAAGGPAGSVCGGAGDRRGGGRSSVDGAAAAGQPDARRSTSATVPTLAYSPSCSGTSSTRSSSPTSTASVTFMLGKTTMSSSGTSNSLLTVGSRSSEVLVFTLILVVTTESVLTFPAPLRAAESRRGMLTERVQTVGGPAESQLTEPGFPHCRLPGPDTLSRLRTPRVRLRA